MSQNSESAPKSFEPRWRRRPEERPQQIIDAALRIFGEQGLAGARLDDIARCAGVAKGTIYLYFPNKEELFREVIRRTVIVAIEEGERAVEVGGAIEQMDAIMSGYWRFVRSEEFATIYRLVIGELHRFPDLAHFYSTEVIERATRLVCAVVQRGTEEGVFRNIDPMTAARMLSALWIMHAVWLNNQALFVQLAGHQDEQVFQQIRGFFLNALLAPEVKS